MNSIKALFTSLVLLTAVVSCSNDNSVTNSENAISSDAK